MFVAATPAIPTNESQCVVTFEVYEAVHDKEPTPGMNMFGWRELDGLVENFPTDDSEKVFYGDSVPVHDEVHIQPCYSWCVSHMYRDRQMTSTVWKMSVLCTMCVM